MSQEPQKMLLAVDSHNDQHMAFAHNQLNEAKEWIWDRYKKCTFHMKDSDDWYVDEIQPDKLPLCEYTLNPEDFFSYEQVKFANFLVAEEYCDEEKKLDLLELLEGSDYEISLKKAKRKKQKTTTEVKN